MGTFLKSRLIFLIITLAFILRFYHLGSNPPSLNWDETAHGYNAYSILKTGRDEYGEKLPLFFRSFDDYKPPLYTYLVVPSVALFNLTDYAVRFPSASIAIFSILFTYLMAYELFKNNKFALLTSFFLAISPWHLQFSRVAFETNSAIFFSVLGTWAFLRGLRSSGFKITLWLSLVALSFGSNLYMYHNARVFTPAYSLVLAALYFKKLVTFKKHLVLPLIISAIFVIVLIPIATSISGQLRFIGTSVFGDLSPVYKASEKILKDKEDGQLLVGKLLHNRRFVYIPIIAQNYFSHFNPNFLFFSADMDRHHAPMMGLLYLWELPFLIAGIYLLVTKTFNYRSKFIVFSWFLLAPVASSVTWGVPHSLRSEIFLPMFQIFTAVGIYTFFDSIKNNGKKFLTTFIVFLFFLNFFFYLHQYYIHMPYEFSKAWKFGRKEAAIFSDSIKQHYDRVIVSTSLEQPHEFWLYYLKYDPQSYLNGGGTVSGGFLEERNKFDKYWFKKINYADQKNEAKTLFIGLPQEFPQDARIIKKINYLNGESAISIVSSQ